MQLADYWNSLVERCGLILKDGSIVELVNTHINPEGNFSFSKEEFDRYPTCIATWHTHPRGNSNLTVEDYEAFLKYPNYFHYIVGDGTVWGFYVREGRVFLYEDDSIFGAAPERVS